MRSACAVLLLLLPSLAALVTGSDSEAGKNSGVEEPFYYQINCAASFYNHSLMSYQCSGWLGDLQTHGWNNRSRAIIFLYPWSRGNFSKKEWNELEVFFASISHDDFSNYATKLKLEYPFEVQVAAGCELHSETTVSFFQMAYQGFDFLSFQNDTWLPSSKGGYKAKHICRRLNHYPHLKEAVHKILRDTCPHFIQGLLEEGKAYFQRQVRPEAWLSSGPSPGPGRLQLVCHVSGFYPKSVQVMWMRGEQEHPGTQRGDVLPNADETWYLRAALDVADGDTAGLCCQVKHSSLGGQDIVLYWEHHNPLGSILVAIVVLALLAGLAFCFRKYWTCHEPASTTSPLQ